MPYNFPLFIKNYIKEHPQKPKRSVIPPALCKSHKPTFKQLWERAIEIYDVNSGGMDGLDALDLAAARIGGRVGYGLTELNEDGDRQLPNACAIRMSYILQYNGIQIPRHGFGDSISGSDKLWYLFRVRNIKEFIPKTWGAPNLILTNLQDGSEIKGKTGLLIFDVTGWKDASGHVTLWNGKRCYDSCYFQEDLNKHGAGKVSKIQFWEIK